MNDLNKTNSYKYMSCSMSELQRLYSSNHNNNDNKNNNFFYLNKITQLV